MRSPKPSSRPRRRNCSPTDRLRRASSTARNSDPRRARIHSPRSSPWSTSTFPTTRRSIPRTRSVRSRADPEEPDARRRVAPRGRVPDDPRRAAARRQLAAQHGDVRHDVDGARGREADGRDVRQEHDRQGRVSADRRDRAALREHRRRAVPRAHRRRRHRRVDDRIQRGRDARWPGDEVEVASAPRGSRAPHRQAEHGDGLQRPGRVGEVLPLLGRRAALRATHRRPVHRGARDRHGVRRREHDRRDPDPRHHLHRRVRADQGDPRSRRRLQRRARHSTSRSTSTPRAAGSSRRSCTPTSSGTSGSRRSSRSTCRATSTA